MKKELVTWRGLRDGENLHAENGLDLIPGVLVDRVRNANLRAANGQLRAVGGTGCG